MWYVGIDLHKKFFMAAAFDETGKQVMKPTRVMTQDEVVKIFFHFLPQDAEIYCESTFNWKYLWRMNNMFKSKFVLLNPRKLKVITESVKKSDRNDCEKIAELASKGLLKGSYIPGDKIQELRILTRTRMYYVNKMVAFKAKTRNILFNYGIEKISYDKEKIRRILGERKEIEKTDRYTIETLISSIEFLRPIIVEYDKKIKEIIDKNREIKEDIRLLMTIPGIGLFRASVIKGEVGEAERFEDAKRFCCYAGIVPSTSASSNKEYHGPLIKESSKYLRTTFIEAANVIKKSKYKLGEDYLNYRKTLPKHSATVKLARKIARITLRVLKTKKPYYEEISPIEKRYFKNYKERLRYKKEKRQGCRPTFLSLTYAN